MKTELFTVNNDVDVVYSPDDNGWYLQKYLHDTAGNTQTSKSIFNTKAKALQEYRNDNIVWEDDQTNQHKDKGN